MFELKNFDEYAQKRLGADRVAEIKKEAEREATIYKIMQDFI